MAYFRKRVYAPYGGSFMRAAKRRRFASSTARVRQFNRRTLKGPSTRGPLSSQVKSLQTVVKKLSPEVKYQETTLSSTNITVAGRAILLCGIAQGDTQATRTGTTINVVSLAVRGAFGFAADAPTNGFCRFLIVKDNQQEADADPLPEDVIDDSIFTANPVVNLPNEIQFGRFTILYSSKLYSVKRMNLNTGNTGVPTQMPNFEYNWTGNIKVSYNGTTGADIQKNGIYLIILTDATGDTLDFSGISRIGYVDA